MIIYPHYSQVVFSNILVKYVGINIALGELERPKNPLQNTKQSTTDLKLAELEASLREIENSKKVKFKENHNIEILHMKGLKLFIYVHH